MNQLMTDLPGTSGYWKHVPPPHHSTATVHLPPGWAGFLKHRPVPDPARVHTAITAALNGWQITLIAVGAALFAAAFSLLVLRRPEGFVSAQPFGNEASVVLGTGRNRGGRGVLRLDPTPASRPRFRARGRESGPERVSQHEPP